MSHSIDLGRPKQQYTWGWTLNSKPMVTFQGSDRPITRFVINYYLNYPTEDCDLTGAPWRVHNPFPKLRNQCHPKNVTARIYFRDLFKYTSIGHGQNTCTPNNLPVMWRFLLDKQINKGGHDVCVWLAKPTIYHLFVWRLWWSLYGNQGFEIHPGAHVPLKSNPACPLVRPYINSDKQEKLIHPCKQQKPSNHSDYFVAPVTDSC